MTQEGRDAGFTLLETVIALTLLAIVMLALSGSIGFVGRNWDKGWLESEKTGALARVEDLLRRSIEGSFPVTAGRAGKEHFLFSGAPNGLQLAGYGVTGQSSVSLQIKEITFNTVGAAHQIVYRQSDLIAGVRAQSANDPGKTDEAIIPIGNLTLHFSYFGTPKTTDTPAWHANWRPGRRLPELIQVRILDGVAPAWPAILIRPHITSDYACVAAIFSGICRSAAATP